ncbi:oligosaccharide flippase family protein [Natrialbaceae archaeon A-CW3]
MSDERSRDVAVASLQSISRGAIVFIVGRIVLDALQFILNLVLTRTLTSTMYGVFAYANTLIAIALVFTNLGSTNSILKYVPQYEDDERKQRFMLGLAYATSFVASFVVAAGLYLAAPVVSRYTLGDPLLVDVLRLFAILLVFDTMVQIIAGTFRSLERLEYSVFLLQFLKPISRLLGVAFALLLGLSFYGVMAALVVASVVVFVVGVYFVQTRLSVRPSFDRSAGSASDVKEYYNLSIPLVLKDTGAIFRSRIDVLMVGFFLTSTAVGIYNVTLIVAAILSLPLAAFNQLFPPVASRLYSNGNLEELNRVFSIVTRWTLTSSLFLGLVAALYRTEILGLFGPEFTAGAAVLAFFVASQLLNNAVGPSGYLLMISGHQYVLLANQWVFGVLNVVLNYYFILEYGLIGAALATATIGALNNVARLLEIWYLEGLFPYTRGFLKPLVASGGAASTMYGLHFVLAGVPLLVAGIVVGLVTYGGLIWLLGIERADREFFGAALGSRALR